MEFTRSTDSDDRFCTFVDPFRSILVNAVRSSRIQFVKRRKGRCCARVAEVFVRLVVSEENLEESVEES